VRFNEACGIIKVIKSEPIRLVLHESFFAEEKALETRKSFSCFKRKSNFIKKNISFYGLCRLLNEHYRACRHFYALFHLVLSAEKVRFLRYYYLGFSSFFSLI
jgi:hypothetical protein